MVTYTVMRGNKNSSVRTTLYVEGEVTLSDLEKLRELCLDALKNSDLLVLNLKKVGEYTHALSILLFLLRRTVQLLTKRLTVYGKPAGYFNCICQTSLVSETDRCSLIGGSPCCIRENLFTGTASAMNHKK